MKLLQKITPIAAWMSTIVLFAMSLATKHFKINRTLFMAIKIAICQVYVMDIIIMKLDKRRSSAIPICINLALKNFMIHAIFGIFDCQYYSTVIGLCWILLDTFRIFHTYFNSKASGFIKYYLTIPVSLAQGICECLCIYHLTTELKMLMKWFLRLFLLAHFIGQCIVLRQRILQAYWFSMQASTEKPKFKSN